jgi:Arc/MetJ-type ribon-helix-helix transcriptional regulator
MAVTKTSYYDRLIARHIKSGRASNKSETVHQALMLLDAVTRGAGPDGATFTGAEDLETLLLEGLASGPAAPMTAERKAKIYGTLKR